MDTLQLVPGEGYVAGANETQHREFALLALLKGLDPDQTSNLPLLIVPVLMAIIGYRFMKKLVFNLIDEVFDVGDALLVRSGRLGRTQFSPCRGLCKAPSIWPWLRGCAFTS